MDRLWLRLALAFGLLSALAALLVALLVSWRMDSQVRRFLVEEQLANSPLVAELSAFYGARGSWEGVEQLFAASARSGVSGSGIGPGMMQHFRLLDAEGRVVYGSGERAGMDTSVSTPILWQGQKVGTLELRPGQGILGGQGMMVGPKSDRSHVVL